MSPQHRIYPAEHNPYMMWRRLESISRYIDGGIPGVIDIDAYEYCDRCYAPLALLEVKRAAAQPIWTAVRRLADQLGVNGYFIRYTESNEPSPARTASGETVPDLSELHVMNGHFDTRKVTPAEWAKHLACLHGEHRCRE